MFLCTLSIYLYVPFWKNINGYKTQDIEIETNEEFVEVIKKLERINYSLNDTEIQIESAIANEDKERIYLLKKQHAKLASGAISNLAGIEKFHKPKIQFGTTFSNYWDLWHSVYIHQLVSWNDDEKTAIPLYSFINILPEDVELDEQNSRITVLLKEGMDSLNPESIFAVDQVNYTMFGQRGESISSLLGNGKLSYWIYRQKFKEEKDVFIKLVGTTHASINIPDGTRDWIILLDGKVPVYLGSAVIPMYKNNILIVPAQDIQDKSGINGFNGTLSHILRYSSQFIDELEFVEFYGNIEDLNKNLD